MLTPGPADKQAFACFAAFDVMAGSRAGLSDLIRTVTSRARFLIVGGTPPDLGVGHPPADSDVLGPAVPADGLTVTVSAGSSLFDDRYGLAALKPAKLTPMRAFPDDSPDPAWLHGDLLLQLCAHHPDTIHHAIRDLTRHTRGGMQLRWKMEGYNSPPRPSGTPRNLLGGQRILRRSYNYDLGVDQNGNLQAGHIFVAYQQDISRQFETIQERLAGEPLIDYVQPFGGGYFFTLSGVRDGGDWYGRTLL